MPIDHLSISEMTKEININDVLVERAQYEHYANKISWSKQGHVVYSPITLEGQSNNLFITYLECIDGRTWQLAPPTSLQVLSYRHNQSSTKRLTAESHTHNIHSQLDQNLLPLNMVSFSNTGWDIFTADSEGHVSIIVTGVKKLTFNNDVNHDPQQQQPTVPAVQWVRTSFNVTELVYSDTSVLPHPDLSTPAKKRANQVVTMKWLNIDKPTVVNFPAVKIQANDQTKVLNGCTSKLGAAFDDADNFYYSYHVQPHEAFGAMHPLVTKQACVGIRRNGDFLLWHQEDHGIEYTKLTAKLDIEEDDEITHATIGFLQNKKLVVSTYCASSKTIRIFLVSIDWGYLIETAKQIGKAPNFRIPDNQKVRPSLSVSQCSKHNLSMIDSDGTQKVTLLDIIVQKHQSDSKPYLLVTLENDRIKSNTDEVKTTMYRYELEEVTADNQLKFNFGSAKPENNATPPVIKDNLRMIFKHKVVLNESVLSVVPINLDTLIAITLANGEIKVFNPESFRPLESKYHTPSQTPLGSTYLPDNISSIFDSGFVYPQMSFQPLFSCISPNNCCYVALPKDGTSLYVRCVEQQVDNSCLPPKRKGLLVATTVAFALCHTSACYSSSSTDDFFAAVKFELNRSRKEVSQEYSDKLLTSILQECQRTINLNINISTEQADRMIQNQQLQRVLNLQLSLGTFKNWKRSKGGQIAWSLVNLRFIGHSVLFTVLTVHQHIQRLARKGLTVPDTLPNAKTRADYIMSLLGIVRWCIDYVIWLNKELLLLSNAYAKGDKEEIDRLIKTSVAIPLILGKIPRSFLLFSLSNIKRLFVYLQKIFEKCDASFSTMQTPENPLGMFQIVEKTLLTERKSSLLVSNDPKEASKDILVQPTVESYYRLGSILSNSPVSIYTFEKFLAEADVALHNIPVDPTIGPAIEQQIVCEGEIPTQFHDALRNICNVYAKSVKKEINIPDLVFYDVDWLQLSSSKNGIFGGYDDNYEEGSDLEDIVDTMDVDVDVEVKEENKVKQEPLNEQGKKFKQDTTPTLLEFTNADLSYESTRNLVQRNITDGYLMDSLRKNMLKSTELLEDGQVTIRKCVRCGAISSVQDDTLFMYPVFIPNPIFQTYQRICFCGGPWVQL